MSEYRLIALHGKLGEGKSAIVDLDDYESVLGYKWYYNLGYARRDTTKAERQVDGRTVISMQAVIMGLPAFKKIDHINRNRLDNRKSNLRLCSQLQNSRNRKGWDSVSSHYKGVSLIAATGRWRARIRVNYVDISLGCYATEQEAAKAYDDAAKLHYEEFAHLNFS